MAETFCIGSVLGVTLPDAFMIGPSEREWISALAAARVENPPAREHELVHGVKRVFRRLGAVELDEGKTLVLGSGSVL